MLNVCNLAAALFNSCAVTSYPLLPSKCSAFLLRITRATKLLAPQNTPALRLEISAISTRIKSQSNLLTKAGSIFGIEFNLESNRLGKWFSHDRLDILGRAGTDVYSIIL